MEWPCIPNRNEIISLERVRRTCLEYVEWAIRWSNVSNNDKNQVHKGPYSKASKAEEFSKALSPVPQVKSVHAKTTQG